MEVPLRMAKTTNAEKCWDWKIQKKIHIIASKYINMRKYLSDRTIKNDVDNN